jgi:hypothetical protein
MRHLSLALALSTVLALPVAASADQQSTGAQSDFRKSVKAQHPSYKRHQIIRAESGKKATTGVAPSGAPR